MKQSPAEILNFNVSPNTQLNASIKQLNNYGNNKAPAALSSEGAATLFISRLSLSSMASVPVCASG